MIKTKKNIVYSFFIDTQLRILRHLVLIGSIFIVTTNNILITFNDNIGLLGNWIYPLGFYFFLINTVLVYINFYVFVPRYLFNSKYIEYIGVLLLSTLIYETLNWNIEYQVEHLFINPLNEYSFAFIAKFIGDFSIALLFNIGISMIILFRKWLTDEETIRLLEKKKLQTQIVLTKEQVNPEFLSRILKKSASITVDDPYSASTILIILSKILRYQLYDSGRSKVLLKSEIEYINNYLTLERLYHKDFTFYISGNYKSNMAVIRPRLILPFIQEELKLLHAGNPSYLKLNFLIEDSSLLFSCFNGNNTNFLRIEIIQEHENR